MKTEVVIIGGGATGCGVLRDLAMRGVRAVLVEQSDLAHGTSSRFHGLLHSGGRYAVKDLESAAECIEENRILRRIGRYCVEETEGLFVRLPQDGEDYEAQWLAGCRQAGITVEPITTDEARRLEPALVSNIAAVYKVPDAAIDGFRLVWQNAAAARAYGGQIRTYTEVTAIKHSNNQVAGVIVRNRLTGETETIACNFVVNAAGSWAGHVSGLAGIDISVVPDRGTLVAFNHRITNHVINRLRPPSDGDIFVPHGSIAILGTTSSKTDRPDDFIPRTEEALAMLKIGGETIQGLENYRILRTFSGTRPLYSKDSGGRSASRSFAVIDHAETDGLKGFVTIVGGKLTTYRLMAEKAADAVCRHLGVNAPCRTADEPLVAEADHKVLVQAEKFFPAYGVERAVSRLGPQIAPVVEKISANPEKRQLVCECELVTLAEVETVAAEATSFNLDDIRRRTRMGMGTCQGTFCAFRGIGVLVSGNLANGRDAGVLLKEFIQSRWSGIRPILWGNQLREAVLMRAIYDATLNIDGAVEYEKL